jgi:hypothetical protein
MNRPLYTFSRGVRVVGVALTETGKRLRAVSDYLRTEAFR